MTATITGVAELCNYPVKALYINSAKLRAITMSEGEDSAEQLPLEEIFLPCERPHGHPGNEHVIYRAGGKYIHKGER